MCFNNDIIKGEDLAPVNVCLCTVGCLSVCTLFVASVFVVLLCRDLTNVESRVKIWRLFMYLSPLVANAAVRSKAVVLLLLIYC